MKAGKKFLIISSALLLIAEPAFAFGPPTPIIPNCSPNCGFVHLLQLARNLVDWVIWISIPVAAGVFAWAGIKLMTSGVVDQKSEAKKMLKKVFLGLVFILSAWLIVSTITDALLSKEFKENIQLNLIDPYKIHV